MKSLIVLLILWTTMAIAQVEMPLKNNSDTYKPIERPKAAAPVYQVPVNHPNTDELLAIKPNIKTYGRRVKCNGENYVLLYTQSSGLNPGTTYLNLCNLQNGIECLQDSTPKTRDCRTRAVKHYQAGNGNTTTTRGGDAETIDQSSTPTSR